MAEFVRLAHPEIKMAAEAEDACIVISGLVQNLNTHLGLYKSLEEVVGQGDRFKESEVHTCHSLLEQCMCLDMSLLLSISGGQTCGQAFSIRFQAKWYPLG